MPTNHAGDVLNFELVAGLAEMEGIHTRQIYVSDDITSAEKTQREERRGIAGVSLIVKIAAAASEAGLSLEEVYEIASMANKNYLYGQRHNLTGLYSGDRTAGLRASRRRNGVWYGL